MNSVWQERGKIQNFERVWQHVGVRNIPNVNQILTGVQCWKRIEGFPGKNAQFNEDFPPLIEENKNKTEEKMGHNQRQINLSSVQVPATPASTLHQPPSAQPAASRPPASHPLAQPASQVPAPTLQPIRKSHPIQLIK
ncbi:hypothetical protein DSO57_1016730 [Entomophthora muscae]|uniref:Uncharacterized protein n=1 Tax=Entomophthora muscae TaxID=34485 RepID=A0ACC2RW91_9FUNG|nr:hypothetical protein DSO57_1016730 [Entomophthora muscae]